MNPRVRGHSWIITILLLLLFQRPHANVTEINGCEDIPNKILTVAETTDIGSTIALMKSVSCMKIKESKPPIKTPIKSNNSNGVWKILVASDLDLEKTKKDLYKIETECCTIGTKGETYTFTLTVSPVNEFAPKFKNALVSIPIPESTAIGSTIFEMKKDNPATDEDYNTANSLQYSIEQEQGDTNFWSVGNLLTGSIVLNKMLDFETQQRFILNISAQERNTEKKKTYSLLIINVTDVDDKNPEFDHSSYNLIIPEGSYTHTCFKTDPPVYAYDGDLALDETIKYTLAEENDAYKGLFSVSTNGSLCVEKKIEKGNYLINIKAMQKDKPDFRQALAVINLIVTDVNDHGPVMNSDHYAASISEGAAIDTIILVLSASDQDEGDNADFEFKLDGSESEKFKIETNLNQGLLKINKELDRESKEVYHFQIYAQETKTKERKTSVKSNITVHVLDENDNSPKFTQPDSVEILENSTIGTSVIQVKAVDADKGAAGAITYSFLQTSGDLFAIDLNNGMITLNCSHCLDYEETKEIILIVKAQDNGDPPRNSLTTVLIKVVETEFMAPEFTQSLYKLSVPENKDPGFLMKLQASDEDTRDSDLVFSLDNSVTSNIKDFIKIEKNGTISAIVQFDAETMISDLNFSVTVSDGHSLSHADVNISIIDVNEFSPEISMPANVTIFENSTLGMKIVTNIKITDKDKSNDGFKVWLQGDEGTFYLDPNTYDISIIAPIDRQVRSVYSVVVHASDLGKPPRSSQKEFKVFISDSNTAPIFVDENNKTVSNYTFDVKENVSLNDVIGSVYAMDMDAGSSGNVRYHIKSSKPSDDFAIDKTSGQLKVKKILNFEKNKIYTLEVMARDNSVDRKTTGITVEIHVTDIDEAPIWPSPSLQVYMTQSALCDDTKLPDSVKDVTVLIASGDEKSEYFLLNMTTEFSLNNISGLLTNIQKLKPGSYVLGVKACSSGKNICTPASLTVVIKSDSLLAFCHGFYQVKVKESKPLNSQLLNVTVNKQVDDISYSILSGNDEGSFKIDNETGKLQTAKLLDRETTSRYEIVLEANSSSLSEKTEAQVFIEVLDEPDSPPQFTSSSYRSEIKENIKNNTKILRVSASDPDENSQVSYSIDENKDDSNGTFRIDQNGNIYVIRVIDYEDTAPGHTFMFMVLAKDGIFTSNATVTIKVLDENDQQPVFDALPQNVSILEGVKVPYMVLRVNASDEDSNDRIVFSMELLEPDGIINPFVINPINGQLNVVGSLDRETVSSYHVKLTAKDLMNHEAITHLLILITDKNDNSPVFSHTKYNMTVKEGPGGNGTTLTLNVTDIDEGQNSKLECSITSGNENNAFECQIINDSKVVLRTMKVLHWSPNQNEIILEIKATDAGSPLKSGTCKVRVSVMDINDNMPVFSSPHYNADVDENAKNNTQISLSPEFSVTDMDSEEFGKPSVEFDIAESDTTPFNINTTTGEIVIQYTKLAPHLDRENVPAYNITIVATDGGGLSSNATVKITINDVDDTAPYFLMEKYEFLVSEDSKFGFSIGKVEAKDNDISSRTIFYTMESTKELPFALVHSTGELLVVGRLNADYQRQYTFNISASDGIHKTFVEIVVNVTKQEYQCPVESSNFDVLENQPINTVFGNLTAIGLEAGNSTYTIKDAEWRKIFNVSSSGGLSLLQSLDDTSVSLIKFDVKRRSDDTHCVIHINLTILRSNDYAPEICFQGNCGVLTIEFTLTDNSPKNTIVGDIHTRDNDTGTDGEIITKLDPSGYISIDALGILRLDKKFNLVQLKSDDILSENTNIISFNLTATDRGTPPKSTTSTIHVKVLSNSPNQPRFSQNTYDFDVMEGLGKGASVGNVSVSTNDVLYSVSIGNGQILPFSINKETGEIFTSISLDRETESMYKFVVMATESKGNKLSAATLVNVTVKDINDNKPEFIDVPQTVTVKEKEVKNNIFTVSAKDLDEGENAAVTYSFMKKYSMFSINSTSGMVSLTEKLDRETTPRLEVVIKASDKGSPVLISNTTVLVVVEDVNDEAPVFSSPSFTKTVKEMIGTQEPIIKVTATDKDGGGNGHVFYTLKQSGDPVFKVSPLSGNIYSIFPKVKSGTYNLIITATDNGNPPLSSTANVTIVVSSNNSSQPALLTLTTEQVDLFVGMRKGTDINVTIEIDNSVYLDISGDEGVFKFKNRRIVLDKDLTTDRDYTLKFTATNPNDENVTKQLEVRVLPLQFDKTTYIAQVPENQKLPFEILDLNSVAEKNSIVPVYYSLLTKTDFVVINHGNGTLSLKKPIDREKVNIINLNVSLEIDQNTMPAGVRRRRDTDSSSPSAKATITIHVVDVNDNPPSFQGSKMEFSIPSNVKAGYNITTLRAFDADDGANSEIEYQILSGNNAAVSIDAKSGILSVVSPSALPETGNLTLLIQACNVNGKSLCDSITVEVIILKNPEFHLTASIAREVFKEHQEDIMRELGLVLGYKLNLTRFVVHGDGGAVDTSRTDIFFHAYKKSKSNETIPSDELSRKISSQQKEINAIFKKFTTVKRATAEELSKTAIIALVAVACAIFFASLVAIVVVCRLSKKQKEAQKKEESALKARQIADDRNSGVTNMSDPDEPLELPQLKTPVQSEQDQETVLTLYNEINVTETETTDFMDNIHDQENPNSQDSGNNSVNNVEADPESPAIKTEEDLPLIQMNKESKTGVGKTESVKNNGNEIKTSPNTCENNHAQVNENLENNASDRSLEAHNNFLNNKAKTESETESHLKNFDNNKFINSPENVETNQISNTPVISKFLAPKAKTDNEDDPYSSINDCNESDSITTSKPVFNIKDYSRKPEEKNNKLKLNDTVAIEDIKQKNYKLNLANQMNEMYPLYSSVKKLHSDIPKNTVVDSPIDTSNKTDNGNTSEEEEMITFL